MIPAHEQQLFELIEQVEGRQEAALVSQLPLDAVVSSPTARASVIPAPAAGLATGPTHFESGAEAQTTNQRMELAAVWNALQHANPGEVEVVSDSMYVVNCFNDRWWQGWRRRNWKNPRVSP